MVVNTNRLNLEDAKQNRTSGNSTTTPGGAELDEVVVIEPLPQLPGPPQEPPSRADLAEPPKPSREEFQAQEVSKIVGPPPPYTPSERTSHDNLHI